nr:immunoglobulin heavy chain junction region [Macaca mulatta]MOY22266.1 immunoglobulin heavy chain junction region [Macaca mulatta]MOY22336.1 immunoglobulin heavy chain junction region [Macaca mulatta]MOY22464.1 immunoglobulin heavy chain junction region [Macaca mulatta]MOY22578.1 immunoglobulin heavy chain junction region [Macaca mulatta]
CARRFSGSYSYFDHW